MPLAHAPGHAQVDFGEALGVIGGVQRKLHYFAMALPQSDAFFIKAYPAETTEAFCDGHVSAFGGNHPLASGTAPPQARHFGIDTCFVKERGPADPLGMGQEPGLTLAPSHARRRHILREYILTV